MASLGPINWSPRRDNSWKCIFSKCITKLLFIFQWICFSRQDFQMHFLERRLGWVWVNWIGGRSLTGHRFLGFLPEASYGLRVLSLPASVCVCVCVCVCMCVCVSVNHQFVRTITCHPLKLQSPNLDQKCKTPWLRCLLFLGFIDLDLQGQIELKSQNLPHFGLVSLSGRQVNTKWSEAFQIWTKNAS